MEQTETSKVWPELSHYDLHITKASVDPQTGEMRWACVASDVFEDSLRDSMHKSLFDSFLHRINKNVAAPEPWQTEFWKGGMPYLSVSHYSDGNGRLVPGPVSNVFLDGDLLKAKGGFSDTPLGKAAFASVRDSVKKMKSGIEDGGFQPVRISIGFLDFKHTHKSNGFTFERKSLDMVCPECVQEHLSGKREGVTYQEGQLIHLALTRVPVNQRTEIGLDVEVDRAMTTRKGDAASIVGEELAEEIQAIEEEMVNPQKALVTKSEEEPEVVAPTVVSRAFTLLEQINGSYQIGDVFRMLEEAVWNVCHFGSDKYPTAESMKSAVKSAIEEAGELITARSLVLMGNYPEKDEKEKKDKKPMKEDEEEEDEVDKSYAILRAKLATLDKSDKKNAIQLQGELNTLAVTIEKSFGGNTQAVVVQATTEPDLTSIVAKAVAPLMEKMLILEERMKSPVQEDAVVQRGLTAPQVQVMVNDPANHGETKKAEVSELDKFVNRSVGLPENYVRQSTTIVPPG